MKGTLRKSASAKDGALAGACTVAVRGKESGCVRVRREVIGVEVHGYGHCVSS